MKQKRLSQLLVVLAMILSVVLIGSAATTLTDGQLIRGDVNGDGAVNMKDVLLIRKYIADMDVEFADHICSVAPSESQSQPSASETQPSYTQPIVTEPSYTQPIVTEPSYTQPSETQPSYTTPSQTQPSQSQPAGDTVTLSLNVEEESPRYDTHARTDSFQVPKGENTVVFTLPDVYHAKSDYTPETAAERVALTLNGTPITATSIVITDANDIVFTYNINVTANSTIGGKVQHPNHDPFTVSVNGQGGETPTQAPTEPGVTHSAPDFLLDPNAETVIDRVTLTFYDKDATQYGITFHSYETLSNPVVQYVQGATDNFASAQSVNASTETLKGFMAYDYDPTDFSFTAKYEERNNSAGTMPEIADYTHKAALPVLSYGTTYSYRVGGTNAKGETVYSSIYSFTTRPQSPTDFSFIWMSDSQYSPYQTGINARFRNVLNSALTLCSNPDMLLHGGDFSDAGNYLWTYAAEVSGNEDFFTKYPLMSASGNHDTVGTSEIYRLINVDLKGTGRNASQSTSTGTYYSYDYGNAHFVVLNISKDASIDATQLSWVSKDLSETNKQWKFVYFHRPMYTCVGEKEADAMDDGLCSSLEPVFNQYGVDVVIQAHVHMYSRTKPITSLGTVATGWTTKTEDNYEYTVNPGAPIYTVTATAASNVEHIYRGASAADAQPAYLAKYASGKANSFAIYHVNGNTLSVDACYVDDNGGNLQYYDKFGIIKAS